MAYEIKFAKVTCSGKLPDRFLSCQHTASTDLAQSAMGEVFSIVEILSPWFPTAQIGQLVINTFSKSYFQGGSTSDLLNFEDSLKKVNEALATATQNGETDWIGKLNGMLAVIIDNNLHIAPTGKIEGYIFRDGKINHLTEGLSGSVEVHPLKTFSNVISGEIKPQDKILLTSGDLFNHLSVESVRQIITLNTPSMAASQITKLLRKAKVKNVNFIIASLYSAEELSKIPGVQEEQETVYYLDKSTDSIVARLKYFWNNILSPLGRLVGNTASKATKKSIDVAAAKIKNIKDKKPALVEKEQPVQNIADDNKDNFHREFISDNSRDDSLLSDEEINYSPDVVHYYNEQKVPKESKFGKVFDTISLNLKKGFSWILTIAKDKKKRNYLYIALAIIFIAVVILFTRSHSQKAKVGNLEAQQILNDAIAAEKDADSSLANGNQEQAKTQFAVAIEKAQSILNNSLVAKDAQTVLASAYESMDKLTATTRYSTLTAIETSPIKSNQFFTVAGDVYFIGDDTIYRGNILGVTPQKVATLPASKGSIIASAMSDKTIFLYTSNQMMFALNTSTSKLDQLTLPAGKWETANSIFYYSSSLYLLDGVLGQIYKHASTSSGFDSGSAYLANPSASIKQGLSIAVDGSIFVLTANGKVVEYKKSKAQDFTLAGLPTPYSTLTEPKKIFTDSDTTSLYILDNAQKRIVEFDKDGQFVHQYALPESFDQIKDFDVSVKSRKIWVLQENSVYELNI